MSSSVPETRAALAEGVTVTDDALVVDLVDGRTVSVPLAWYPRLLHGSSQERAKWRLVGRGEGIHWPDLDEDVSIAGLLDGRGSAETADSLRRCRLTPCPKSPNCVSTEAEATDRLHAIAPICYSGPADAAKARLRAVIDAIPRTEVVEDEGDYLHVTFRSPVLRFVDDVQFVVDDATKTIRFRSASRVGHSDLGANRRRMEEIRRRFSE